MLIDSKTANSQCKLSSIFFIFTKWSTKLAMVTMFFDSCTAIPELTPQTAMFGLADQNDKSF